VSNNRVDFTRSAAERIAAVVRTVETGERDESPLTFRKISSEGGAGRVIRLATFDEPWLVGESKVLEFYNQTTTPNTVSVTNYYLNFDPTTECQVVIGRDRGNWYLLQADLTKQQGYEVADVQVFGHGIASDFVRWFSVTECGVGEESEEESEN
jgi:hypothetical protein